ncbi:hypothetical protein CHUAL_004458 [Chamberlinius hualienensis]
MNSVDPSCNELKKIYDDCFNSWFSEKFLKGHTTDTCAPLFQIYQDCVKDAVKKQKIDFDEVHRDVLGTDKEKVPRTTTK